jgi:hypothetical protein
VYGRIGVAEDIHDVIYDISPTDTPVLTAAKRLKATNVYHQWQTDVLSSAGANIHIEGDDATFATQGYTTMLGNNCAISKKTVVVSRTADVVKKYGRGSEMGYLIKQEGKALKRDIELMMLGAQGGSAGSVTAARQTAGFRAQIANIRNATGTATTGGTQPGFAAAAWGASTDGTAVTFIEADLKAALELAWTDGGDPSMIVSNTRQKQRASAFAGASAFEGFSVSNGRSVQGAVIAGIDLYVSDYGSHKWTLDRFCGQTGVLCLDPEYMAIAWLDPIAIEDLAKTGDSKKKQIVCEWAAVLTNPDAHAQVKACL